MSGLTALAVLCGAGVGFGVWLVVLGARGVTFSPPVRRVAEPGERRRRMVRLAAAGGAAVAAGAVTGWPVGAVLAGVGAWLLPRLLGRDRDHDRQLARIEAIATWAEQLRDTLAAAAGVEQAILATAATAPEPIRPQVGELAAAIDQGERLGPALRAFAGRLADPTADLVVAALLQAAEHHARNLADLLSSLAAAAREQAGMRMRVAAGRARTRTTVRVIVTATLAMAGALVLLNRGYLAPYDSPAGQLALLAVGGLFGVAFGWLHRLARPREPDRFLVQLAALDPWAADRTREARP
jgi:Flp pilus assembly protein TadB